VAPDETQRVEDEIQQLTRDLKNYRRLLKRLKAKTPDGKPREDVAALAAEVIARDPVPMPSKKDLERFTRCIPDYILDDQVTPSWAVELPPEDMTFASANEELTGFDACELVERADTLRVDRAAVMPGLRGFHSSYDKSIRYQLRLVAEKIEYRIETIEHIESGKRARADLSAIGPDRCKATWDTIALLVCLAIQMAMPIDRLRKLFASVNALSGASICRYLELSAQKLLPIYLYFIEQLATSVAVLAGDDTKTKVLDMKPEGKAEAKGQPVEEQKNEEAAVKTELRDDMLKQIEEKLGRAFPRKDGQGDKTQINVSHLHGRTDIHEPRSTIYFFRTHFGSVGDLLTRILSLKKESRHKPITFQGDLSSTNFPDPSLFARWISYVAGCAAHARRVFFRFRGDDDPLCDKMLELFAMVHAVEHYLDKAGRSPKLVLKERRRLALPLWRQIIALAHSVLDAESKGRARSRWHFLWPKSSHIYKGCQYIVKHQEELTRYIFDYRLSATNNAAERMLRGEKILIVSCKFRKSEAGRVVFDILRTIVMTAQAASGNPKAYLSWVLKQSDEDIKKRPQDFTPFAYYQKQQQTNSTASDLQPTGT
jgi:hypothetical protein